MMHTDNSQTDLPSKKLALKQSIEIHCDFSIHRMNEMKVNAVTKYNTLVTEQLFTSPELLLTVGP